MKMVRSGARSTSCSTLGVTRGIQAMGQGPSSENRRCMSMQRWAVLGPIGALSSPMALKARSSGMAQPERIEEPERQEDQQRYAAESAKQAARRRLS